MDSVRMNKSNLLEIVRVNRAKHLLEYEEAVKDYLLAVATVAKHNLDEVTANRITNMKHLPVTPNTFETDYNRAIRMLELSVDTAVEIDEQVFKQLVLDEWSWKHSFSVSNSSYKSY